MPVFLAFAIQAAGPSGPTASEGVPNVISAASWGGLVVLVLGILFMAGEFRHNTATSTFLISPDRAMVVRANRDRLAVAGGEAGRGDHPE